MTNEQKFHIVYQNLLRGRNVYYLGKEIDDVRVGGLFLEVRTSWGWRACNVAPQYSPEGGCPLWQVVENAPEHQVAPLPLRYAEEAAIKFNDKFTLKESSSFVDRKFPRGAVISCAGFEVYRDEISRKEYCFPVYLFPDGTYRQEMWENLNYISPVVVGDCMGVF